MEEPKNIIVVDVGDIYENYINLDPKIRDNPVCTVADMDSSVKFEAEMSALFECVKVLDYASDCVVNHSEQQEAELHDIGEKDEDGFNVYLRPATKEEEEIVSKYANSLVDLGEMLCERLVERGIYRPEDNTTDLKFKAIVDNQFMLLEVPKETSVFDQ